MAIQLNRMLDLPFECILMLFSYFHKLNYEFAHLRSIHQKKTSLKISNMRIKRRIENESDQKKFDGENLVFQFKQKSKGQISIVDIFKLNNFYVHFFFTINSLSNNVRRSKLKLDER